MKNIHFAFFGTPEVASRTLVILAEAGYMPAVIVTSPDRRSGRGLHITETPVALWARDHNIECLKPEKIDGSFIEDFKKRGIELSIVIAYGKILPEELITSPSIGTLNIHYSLLPEYRGASPVEEAILKGDTKTGVSIQEMAWKLDSGPILVDKEVAIKDGETKIELLERLTTIGAELLRDNLPHIFAKEITPRAQDEAKATYSRKIEKEDGELDPGGNAGENYNKYRAYLGWPGVYFWKGGKRIKITKARYEDSSFIIERVIPEGRKEVEYDIFVRSNT